MNRVLQVRNRGWAELHASRRRRWLLQCQGRFSRAKHLSIIWRILFSDGWGRGWSSCQWCPGSSPHRHLQDQCHLFGRIQGTLLHTIPPDQGCWNKCFQATCVVSFVGGNAVKKAEVTWALFLQRGSKSNGLKRLPMKEFLNEFKLSGDCRLCASAHTEALGQQRNTRLWEDTHSG